MPSFITKLKPVFSSRRERERRRLESISKQTRLYYLVYDKARQTKREEKKKKKIVLTCIPRTVEPI
uniref:Uncharacterized protein n=1 Tax=Nelumbo nucifera TaxID=4432 RepID=A0A822ZWB0_NELNU|nr:TPA_asm: hypothetical protein HUJ06_018707 [Nelumbo nucifera]